MSASKKVNHDRAARIADEWKDGHDYHFPAADVALLACAYKDAMRERDVLRVFAESVLREVCWGYDADGGSVQDKAESLGLIVRVPADEAFREDFDADEMFVPAWSDAARATTTKPEESGEGCAAHVVTGDGSQWWCTLSAGHAGEHVAEGWEGKVFHRWPAALVSKEAAA